MVQEFEAKFWVNEFWTRKSDFQQDAEQHGYEVAELNDEYAILTSDDEEWVLYFNIAGTTMTVSREQQY